MKESFKENSLLFILASVGTIYNQTFFFPPPPLFFSFFYKTRVLNPYYTKNTDVCMYQYNCST